MKFSRVPHDGLYTVINNWDGAGRKIVFVNREYETTDVEECEHLIDMGYKFEEEGYDAKEEAKKRLKRAETAKANAKKRLKKGGKEVWNVWQEGEDKPVHTADTKKDADDWITGQDEWEKMESKKA